MEAVGNLGDWEGHCEVLELCGRLDDASDLLFLVFGFWVCQFFQVLDNIFD